MTTAREIQEKVEPDIALCRTQPLGVRVPGSDQEVYYCLIEFLDCKYIRPFGFDCLCRHPEARAFCKPESSAAAQPRVNPLT